MTKQNTQQPQQKSQPQTGQKAGLDQQEQQSGRSDATQAGQSSGRQSPRGGQGSQDGAGTDQQGSRSRQVSDSPEMSDDRRGQSGESLRRGALDTQYGTDSSSKAAAQSNQPQDANSQASGSGRDSMSGSRTK